MSRKNYPTTSELFTLINNNLKEKDLLPDHLEYDLPCGHPGREIQKISFDCFGRLVFGSNEGIYLEMFVSGYFTPDGVASQAKLGTYKTLRNDKEAYKEMANLEVEFVFELMDYIDNHMERFD